MLPFLKAEQIRRFTRMCGARLPAALEARLDRLAHDDEAVRRLGVEVAVDLCRKALAHGVPGLHFYCLNRVASCREVLAELDLLPITPRGAGFQPAGRESPRPGEHVRPRP